MEGELNAPVTTSASAAMSAGAEVGRLGKSTWRDYLELTKPRLTALALATTLVGFFMASRGAPDRDLLFYALLGAAFLGGVGRQQLPVASRSP